MIMQNPFYIEWVCQLINNRKDCKLQIPFHNEKSKLKFEIDNECNWLIKEQKFTIAWVM